jgi:hypothetical protein
MTSLGTTDVTKQATRNASQAGEASTARLLCVRLAAILSTESANNLEAASVVQVGVASSVTSALHIQAASMVTAMDPHGSAYVTQTGVESSVIKISTIAGLMNPVRTEERVKILHLTSTCARVLKDSPD